MQSSRMNPFNRMYNSIYPRKFYELLLHEQSTYKILIYSRATFESEKPNTNIQLSVSLFLRLASCKHLNCLQPDSIPSNRLVISSVPSVPRARK